MNIISFSRMRCYRKNGRISVILKLRLPLASEEGHAEFNSLYEKLSEKYLELPEKASYSQETGARPAVVSVDYSIITDEYVSAHPKSEKRRILIAIKRSVKINLQGRITEREYLDLYDTENRLFIR